MAPSNGGERSGQDADHPPETGGERVLDREWEIDRAGEVRLEIIALDHALNAARWMLSGRAARVDHVTRDADAGDPVGPELAGFEDLRERVRGIRNVITHYDDRIAVGYPAEVETTPDGITARQRGITFSLGFVEWERWLDNLERWCLSVAAVPEAASTAGG